MPGVSSASAGGARLTLLRDKRRPSLAPVCMISVTGRALQNPLSLSCRTCSPYAPGGFDHHVGHLQALRMMSQSSHALVLRCVSAFALHRETHGVADAMIGEPLPLSLPLSSRALLTQNEGVVPVAAV